ncbi:MAG TPA: ABC transporter permease [Candidatus Scatomorpha merdavium]|nr:ABC transporter permease [Candidatus Scatomorpha merdavium]
MRERLDSFWYKAGTRTVLASLASIVIGLLVGCIVILVVGYTSDNLSAKSAWEGVRIVLGSIFSTGRSEGALTFGFNPVSTGNMLFRATPLIMTGLSVAVAFKTGLFNIGAPGQYLMGTMASLMIALSIPSETVPPTIIWIIAFLGGMAAGALWGCIPGLVKAYLNINEVLASIMTNWIAANLVTWCFEVSNFKNVVENTKTNYIYKTTFNDVATAKLGLDKLFPGSQVNGGIIVAILIAILMYVVINKTTLGYELKACGSNRHAARYAGIKDKRNIVLSMAIAGALAGGGAALYYLSGNTEFYWQTYQSLPATGFNGIPVALLAANNPVGVVFTGIFMSMLDIAGQQLTSLTPYNEYLTDVIIAVIVYLSAFSLVIKMLITGKKTRKAMEAIPKLGYEPQPKKEEPQPAAAAETEKGGDGQ